MTACDSGTRAAPNTPCSRRNSTIWLMSCASPHITEAMVKPPEHRMKMRLRPNRLAIHPTGAVMMAAATM